MNDAAPQIVLTQMEISPFCDKVRRVLCFKRLAYEARDIRVLQISALPKMASNGKVPILDYDGHRICDSTDISLWLEQRHPSPALVPSEPRARADTLILEDWADESLYFYEMTMRFVWPDDRTRWGRELARHDMWPVRMLAPLLVHRLSRTIAGHQGAGRRSRQQILEELHRLFGALESRIGTQGFCVGDALTLADISVAAQVHCIQGSSDGARLVAEHAVLANWKERVDALTTPG